jgi:hypothetical protein
VRIPSPGPLRLDRRELLRDARERLLERLPDLASTPVDPTDPGWLLLEQAAWMVEVLSARLDDYPLAVLQQLLHLLGGEMLAAVPSIGVVAVQPREPGVLAVTEAQPAPVRFFAPQTETRDQVEFVPVEGRVPLRPVSTTRLWRWDGVSLSLAGRGTGLVRTGTLARSPLFRGETITLQVIGVEGDPVAERLETAVQTLMAGEVGWLRLTVEPEAGGARARLTAQVDPAAAFAHAAPGGLTDGEPLEGRWGALDDSTWTPPVRLSQHASLPPWLRGQTLEPGREDGRVVIHDVPPGVALGDLLEQPAAPLPTRLADDLWTTLGRIDPRLARLRAVTRRSLSPAAARTAPWLAAAVRSARWGAITAAGPCDLIELQVEPSDDDTPLRIGVFGEGPAPEHVELWTVLADGSLGATSRSLEPRWSLRLPSPTGTVSVHVVELPVDPDVQAILLHSRAPMDGALANPVLVANTPVVRDGRSVTVRRAVPEPVALLETDIVGPTELERLRRRPFGAPVAKVLSALPLARFSIDEDADLDGFSGVALDARAGELRLNAPDASGTLRDLPPGTELHLDWYRRTDGSTGNVGVGEIRLVEQAPSARPGIRAATNPLPTVGGQDRESDEDARARLFAPGGTTLALPADWERELRALLGAGDWRVRAWTHTERALVTTALWPADPDAQRALRRRLGRASPASLLLCVGRSDRAPSAEDLARATVLAEQLCAEARRRACAVREVLVAPLTPVWLEGSATGVVFPTHDTAGLSGTLVDAGGRRMAVPVDTLLLDAVVLGTRDGSRP